MSLDSLKMELDDNLTKMNNEVLLSIREGKITPQMGTSLLNDTTYAHNAARSLLKMGETLFIKHNMASGGVGWNVLLNEDELREAKESAEADIEKGETNHG
jgi:phosphate:Na+ symporter